MREFSLVKQNILYFIEKQNISKYELYQKTGISNGVLSQKGGMSEENTINFEENIYQQNAWYGYRITSIDRVIHFVEEADRVGNMITHEGIKRRLNS